MQYKVLYNSVLKNYPDVMTIDDICKILSISHKTGYKLLHENQIKNIRIGRFYRITKMDLLSYLHLTQQL